MAEIMSLQSHKFILNTFHLICFELIQIQQEKKNQRSLKKRRWCLLKHQSTTSPVCPESLASKRVSSEGAVAGILFDTATSWVFIVDVKQAHGDHSAFFRPQVCPAKFTRCFTVPCCHSNTSIKFHGHFQRAGTLCSIFFDVFLSMNPFVLRPHVAC